MTCFNLQDIVSRIKDGADKIAKKTVETYKKAENTPKEFGKKVVKKAGEAGRTVSSRC